MSLNRKMSIGAIAFVIALLLLEVNSPIDRLLQSATRTVFRFARNALDFLVANS